MTPLTTIIAAWLASCFWILAVLAYFVGYSSSNPLLLVAAGAGWTVAAIRHRA